MKKIYLSLLLLAAPLLALEEDQLVWDEEPEETATEYNSYLQDALAGHDWWSAIDYADIIAYNFPTSPFAEEIPYLTGYSYYQLGHFEHANEALSAYLNHSSKHSHFEEAIQMKFEIAEAFCQGKKKRLFGSHKMPAWLSAKEDALEIYEEVAAMLPHSDLAAKSLLSKARIQSELGDYKPAVETLTALIRRFPKHETAAEAYLEIEKVYYEQCKNTSLDLDTLDLAGVNLRKFALAFPRENKITEAKKIYTDTEELFATNLYETGEFFERTHKKDAALIYYNKVISKYPATKAAELAQVKLSGTAPEDFGELLEERGDLVESQVVDTLGSVTE